MNLSVSALRAGAGGAVTRSRAPPAAAAPAPMPDASALLPTSAATTAASPSAAPPPARAMAAAHCQGATPTVHSRFASAAMAGRGESVGLLYAQPAAAHTARAPVRVTVLALPDGRALDASTPIARTAALATAVVAALASTEVAAALTAGEARTAASRSAPLLFHSARPRPSRRMPITVARTCGRGSTRTQARTDLDTLPMPPLLWPPDMRLRCLGWLPCSSSAHRRPLPWQLSRAAGLPPLRLSAPAAARAPPPVSALVSPAGAAPTAPSVVRQLACTASASARRASACRAGAVQTAPRLPAQLIAHGQRESAHFQTWCAVARLLSMAPTAPPAMA